MTSAQGWVALGILAAFAGLLITLVLATITSMRNELSVRLDALGARTDGVSETLSTRIDGVGETLSARIDGVRDALTTLDRDVQAIARRVFGNP